MRTKTEQCLTVHLDASDVRALHVGSLLSLTDSNDDSLHIFLSPQGLQALREALGVAAPEAADS